MITRKGPLPRNIQVLQCLHNVITIIIIIIIGTYKRNIVWIITVYLFVLYRYIHNIIFLYCFWFFGSHLIRFWQKSIVLFMIYIS